MKKHFLLGIVVGSIVTAASIILSTPTNGEELVEEFEVEEETIKEKIEAKIH